MPHYEKAPITEAIIDIQVTGGPSATRNPISKELIIKESGYSTVEDMVRFQGQITMGASMTTSAKQDPAGYRITSKDGKQVFQIREDGFTFSRLAPYQDWEIFSSEAKRLWGLYRSHAAECQVTRVGLRYINRLNIPGDCFELKDYLHTHPETSSEWPLRSYFMRLEIPQDDLQAVALITQGLLPPPNDHLTSILLDIDVFRQQECPTEEEGLWKLFEQFRVRKNYLFESCIADPTRRLIS